MPRVQPGNGERPLRLTPEQERVVKASASGDLLVKGFPGSGKTLVIVHRAAKLFSLPARMGEEQITPVRIFSFNRMLTEWMKFLARHLGDTPPEIVTFHAWARKAIRELGTRSDDFESDAAVLLEAVKRKGGFPDAFKARHVLVDEAQDLPRDALRVLKMSATESFTVAADKAQNIYATGFTWSSVGIKVKGRVCSLDRSFRGTKQIALLAADLARCDPGLDPGEKEPHLDDLPDGPEPRIYFCSDFAASDRALKEAISSARDQHSGGTVAVLHARKRPTFPIARGNAGRILDKSNTDMISPGVIVSTIHNVKGLEFDTVIIKDVNDGILPYRDEDGNEDVETFRRLLYVAITRARRRVVLVCGHKPSRFVAELDASHYRRFDK